MRAPAHICFGFFSGSVVASFSSSLGFTYGLNPVTLAACAATLLGSTFPDIDTKQSPIAKVLPFLSHPISRRWPHRTLMHSLVGLLISTGIFYLLLSLFLLALRYIGKPIDADYSILYASLFSFSYFSHLALDTTTRNGIRWLYPLIPNAFGYPSLEQYRLITGDRRAELSISLLSLMLFLFYIPITQQGATVSLGNFIGQYDQLRDVYKTIIGREVWIAYEGYRTLDKAPLTGQALILSETATYFIIYQNGQILQLGESGDIRLRKGRCIPTDNHPQEREATYRNSGIADILSEQTGHVLISGHLTANRSFTVNRPFNEHVLTVTEKSLKLSFANKESIQALHITPVTSGQTPSEIEERFGHHNKVLDSLMFTRQSVSDLYQRDQLFDQITEHRRQLKTLERKQQEHQQPIEALVFSGKLSYRILPSAALLSPQ